MLLGLLKYSFLQKGEVLKDEKFRQVDDIMNMEKQKILEEYCVNNMAKLRRICDPFIYRKKIPQMEHDDLYSAALDTLYNTVERYDSTQNSSFKAFLIGNINRTFYDWTRDKWREKRCNVERDQYGKIKRDNKGNPIIISDISLDAPAEDGIDLAEKIDSGFNIEDRLFDEAGISSDERVLEYLNSLPKKARQIVELKMDNIYVEKIKKILGLTNTEYNNYMKTIKTNENLALFTKKENYKEIDDMYEIMPIDITDSYRMDKYQIGGVLDEKKDRKINCKHKLQRKPFQWTKRQKNKFLTRVLNNQPIPEIVICEQVVNGKKKRWLIDGLQRLSYAELYRAKGTVIEEDGAEFPLIYYKERIYENGKPVIDDDGDFKEEIKVFDVIGKKFDELPKFLQDRFNKFNVNVTTFFNCTDEQIAYHIRNYNNQEGMTSNQYEVTNLNINIAAMLKDISEEHPFFKDDYGKYTGKNKTKGIVERIVVESIISINFLSHWKKNPEEAYSFLNKNVTKEMFDNYKDSLDRLCHIVDKNNRELFNTTNSHVWFAVFSRFKKLNLPDSKFGEFMKIFLQELQNPKIYNADLFTTYRSKNTKDKTVVTAKIEGIEKLMLKFLQIETQKIQIEENKEPITILDFVKTNVQEDVDQEDIELYKMSLDDYTIEIDGKAKRIVDKNIRSFVAMVAYAFSQDIDGEMSKWLPDYFKRNTTCTEKNQKQNYLHMKQDLINYMKKTGE